MVMEVFSYRWSNQNLRDIKAWRSRGCYDPFLSFYKKSEEGEEIPISL